MSKESAKDIAFQLLEQGRQQDIRSEFKAALESCQKALTIYHEIGDRLGEACALNNIANVYQSQTAKFYAQAQPLFKEIGSNGEEIVARNFDTPVSTAPDWLLPSGENNVGIPIGSGSVDRGDRRKPKPGTPEDLSGGNPGLIMDA